MYQPRLPDILEDPIQEQNSSSSQCDIMDRLFAEDAEEYWNNDPSLSLCIPSKERKSDARGRGSKYHPIDDYFLKEDCLDIGRHNTTLDRQPFDTSENIGDGELLLGRCEVPSVSRTLTCKEREIDERLARKSKYANLAIEAQQEIFHL